MTRQEEQVSETAQEEPILGKDDTTRTHAKNANYSFKQKLTIASARIQLQITDNEVAMNFKRTNREILLRKTKLSHK